MSHAVYQIFFDETKFKPLMKEVGGVPVSFLLFQSIITIYGFSLSI